MTAPLVDVPFTRSDSWIAVSVRIGGRLRDVVLDTGAPDEIVVPYEDALDRRWITGKEASVYPTGTRFCMVKRRLPVSIGGRPFVLRSLSAWDMDHLPQPETPIRYLMGLRFLMRHQVEFDFVARRVRLYHLDSRPPFPYARAQALYMNRNNEAIYFRAKAGGRFTWLRWDTGAPETFLYRPRFAQMFPGRLDALTWSKRYPGNISGRERQSEPVPIGTVELCGLDPTRGRRSWVRFNRRHARVFHSPDGHKTSEQAAQTEVGGLLQGDVFGAKRLLIDPQRHYLWRV